MLLEIIKSCNYNEQMYVIIMNKTTHRSHPHKWHALAHFLLGIFYSLPGGLGDAQAGGIVYIPVILFVKIEHSF